MEASQDRAASSMVVAWEALAVWGAWASLVVATSLRASWREDERKPETFGLDSDLRGGRETVGGGGDDELWHHPPTL